MKIKSFITHLRIYFFRGILASIPLFLCVIILSLLYFLVDKKVMGVLDRFISIRHIPGVGVVLVIIFLYLIGLTMSNIVGRAFLKAIEDISLKIPFIKMVYGAGKELSQNFLATDEAKKIFKEAVLIKWNNNTWLIAFVAGQMRDERTNEVYLRIFMPYVPIPFAGFMIVVKKAQTINPGWTVEEALKMIISAGIISPSNIDKPATS